MSLRDGTVTVSLRFENKGVYAWVEEIGLTVFGKTKKEALRKVDQAVLHLYKKRYCHCLIHCP